MKPTGWPLSSPLEDSMSIWQYILIVRALDGLPSFFDAPPDRPANAIHGDDAT